MIPLTIGTALALFALAFVLHPLFSPPSGAQARLVGSGPSARPATPAVDALREIEFDRETGKLSDSDYESLRQGYTQRALTEMRNTRIVACVNCGPRPEMDARFCSSCGADLLAPPIEG